MWRSIWDKEFIKLPSIVMLDHHEKKNHPWGIEGYCLRKVGACPSWEHWEQLSSGRWPSGQVAPLSEKVVQSDLFVFWESKGDTTRPSWKGLKERKASVFWLIQTYALKPVSWRFCVHEQRRISVNGHWVCDNSYNRRPSLTQLYTDNVITLARLSLLLLVLVLDCILDF